MCSRLVARSIHRAPSFMNILGLVDAISRLGGPCPRGSHGGGWPSVEELRDQIFRVLDKGRLHVRLEDEDLMDLDLNDLAYVKAGFTWRVYDIRLPAKDEEATARH